MSTVAQFSLEQYDRMIQAGVFDAFVFEGHARQRLELIRGVLVQMNPIGTEHSQCVADLSDWSYETTDRTQVGIRVQLPLRMKQLNSELEPDLLWAVRQDYSENHPEPADALLVLEVADSSLEYDRGEKQNLYAEAGITDYWIVNLVDRQIEVYRDPQGKAYAEKSIYRGEDAVHSLALPEVLLHPSRLFGTKS